MSIKTSFSLKLVLALCFLMSVNAAFGATLPPCSTMVGGNQICGLITGVLTVTSGPDPLQLNGSTITAVTGVENSSFTGWASGWSVLGAPINPGTSHTYTNVPLTLASTGSAIILSCTGNASVTLTANTTGDSLSVASCSLFGDATFTTTINFPANTLPQALQLPFNAVGISPGSVASYTCSNTNLQPYCTSDVVGVPTNMTISGTISSTCIGCTTMGLTPPVSTGFSFTGLQGSAAQTGTVTVQDSSPAATVSYAVTTTTTSGGNWLTASVAGGQIPSTGSTSFTITATPGSLAPGTYHGSVTVYAPAHNDPLTEPVTLTITAASLPALQVSPTSLTFTSTNGSQPSNQNLSITSSGSAIAYTAAATTTTGGNWLQLSSTSGTTPGSDAVSVNLSGLAPGTYSGTVTLTCNPTSSCSNTSGKITVPVTLTVTATLTPSPTSLTFNYTLGGSVPANQGIAVTSNPEGLAYTASASTTSGGSWLAVSPTSATTPTGVTASLNSGTIAGLTAGTYTGSITLTPTSGSPVSVPVTLNVTAAPTLNVSPTTLSFSMTNLGSLPAAQNVSVTSSGAAIPFTTSVSTNSGGTWLAASPASGTTPGTVSVSILANTLAAGTYTGTVTVSSSGVPSKTVAVTLTVGAAPTLSVSPASLTYNYTISSGVNPPSQTASVTASGGAVIPFTASASTVSGGNWLSVSPTSGNTPGTLTISVNPSGLAANTYSGTVTVSSTQSSSAPQTIGVTFTVTAAPTLISSSGSLTFAYQTGGSTPAAEPITISSSGTPLNFTAAASTTSGGSWLSVTPTSGTTPGNLSVSVSPSSLGAGTYTGSITITSAQAGNSPLVIGVTLTVSSQPSLTTSPSSLTFNYTAGGSVPGSQTVAVGSTGTVLSSVTATTSTPWLSVTPSGSTTPLNLTVALVSAGLTGLAPGSYQGTITITSSGAGNSPLTYPVTLVVSAQPVLSVAPTSLTFNGQVGGANPAAKTLSINSTGGSVAFTAAATTVNGGNWLSVSPTSGTTNATAQVSVNTAGLVAGTTYTGSITVTATGATGSPAVIPVTLTLSANALTTSPTTLNFTYQLNGTAPASQPLSVSSTIPGLAFTASAGASWFTVTPGSGTTPQTLTVAIVTAGLTAQTYNSTITLTSAGNSPVFVPVTLVVSNAPPLTANPTSVSFSYSVGGTTPASQTVAIASGGTVESFTAVAATTSGGNWLSVTPTTGNTPSSITLSLANLSALTPATYTGSVTVTATGVAPLVIPVTLVVSAKPSIIVTPGTLTFNYTSGGLALPGQSLAVSTSNNVATAFTASATTTSGGNWLSVSPTSGTSPAVILANIITGSYAPGTYSGTITVSATGFNSATVPVTLVVTQAKATIQITGTTLFTLPNTSAPITSPLNISASDGSAQSFTIAVGAMPTNWLTLNPTSGTTPATVTMTINPAGLAPGLYIAPVTVTMPGLPIPSKTIEVQLTISGSNLTATPSSLSFTYTPGTPLPPAQTIALAPASGSGTVPLASVTTDVSWLKVNSPTSAPATLQVTINPGLLSAGTYSGDVLVKGLGSPTTSLEIPVTITITAAPAITAAPTSLAFTYQIGGTVPAPQSISVSAGANQLSFTATSPGIWLTLSPTRGTTPGTILVTANPVGLAPGEYSGTINVTASGATGVAAVAVTLTVTGTPQLTVTPSQLSFSAPVGGSAPPAQALTITSANGPLSFTASAGSVWLSVTPNGGTTPATVSVTANPAGLTAGTYNGTINITPVGSPTPQLVLVTLLVGNGSTTPTITGIINAASGVVGTVSPGMAISIFGTTLGPQTAATFAAPPDGGTIATLLGGTQVLFDGTPAPILYTSATQVNALVPFAVATKANTVITVEYNGNTSATLTLPIIPAEPGLFTADASGKGEGAILNQDGSINSSTNPAAAGSTIQLFGTGGGVTIPPSTDGALNPISSTGALAAKTTATVNGETATVYYSGPAPNLLSGIIQIDVTLPSDTPSGSIPVVVTVNGVSSQTTVTVFVQ